MDLATAPPPKALKMNDGCRIKAATEKLATLGGVSLGAIFTRSEVVDFILDIAGYTPNHPLHERRFLEPSSGKGDFLLPAISRLLAAWQMSGQSGLIVNVLGEAIRAVELHHDTFKTTREAVKSLLIEHGIKLQDANELVGRWLHQGDFLLSNFTIQFDYVVGNPPYVRQEMIPAPLLVQYRKLYTTMYDRADIYVAFIERSLSLLSDDGRLGFICADRWMKNKYGGPLRRYISKGFHLNAYVDMTDTPAFKSDVIAYPAITLISRVNGGPTRVAHKPEIEKFSLSVLSNLILAKELPKGCELVREISGVISGTEPWLLGSSDQLAVVRKIERDYPVIEDVGCKIGIGVATGADSAFIGDYASMNVEASRKVRLVTTRDIVSGEVVWQGRGVINPFLDNGGLVNLNEFPRLRAYLEKNRDAIAGRHVAKKSPTNWYRTIDRITPALAAKPKLLVPDIKGAAHIVFEEGRLYPHHNLYFITSEEWDLRALQALLMSAVARLFVATYSTKMKGGFLRFQAQYLRRIRVPQWSEVTPQLRLALISAAKQRNIEACNAAAFDLYKLNQKERAALGGNGD